MPDHSANRYLYSARAKVADIYRIDGITQHDKEMFHQYQQFFTVNPPGRSFYERINNRVST